MAENNLQDNNFVYDNTNNNSFVYNSDADLINTAMQQEAQTNDVQNPLESPANEPYVAPNNELTAPLDANEATPIDQQELEQMAAQEAFNAIYANDSMNNAPVYNDEQSYAEDLSREQSLQNEDDFDVFYQAQAVQQPVQQPDTVNDAGFTQEVTRSNNWDDMLKNEHEAVGYLVRYANDNKKSDGYMYYAYKDMFPKANAKNFDGSAVRTHYANSPYTENPTPKFFEDKMKARDRAFIAKETLKPYNKAIDAHITDPQMNKAVKASLRDDLLEFAESQKADLPANTKTKQRNHIVAAQTLTRVLGDDVSTVNKIVNEVVKPPKNASEKDIAAMPFGTVNGQKNPYSAFHKLDFQDKDVKLAVLDDFKNLDYATQIVALQSAQSAKGDKEVVSSLKDSISKVNPKIADSIAKKIDAPKESLKKSNSKKTAPKPKTENAEKTPANKNPNPNAKAKGKQADGSEEETPENENENEESLDNDGNKNQGKKPAYKGKGRKGYSNNSEDKTIHEIEADRLNNLVDAISQRLNENQNQNRMQQGGGGGGGTTNSYNGAGNGSVLGNLLKSSGSLIASAAHSTANVATATGHLSVGLTKAMSGGSKFINHRADEFNRAYAVPRQANTNRNALSNEGLLNQQQAVQAQATQLHAIPVSRQQITRQTQPQGVALSQQQFTHITNVRTSPVIALDSFGSQIARRISSLIARPSVNSQYNHQNTTAFDSPFNDLRREQAQYASVRATQQRTSVQDMQFSAVSQNANYSPFDGLRAQQTQFESQVSVRKTAESKQVFTTVNGNQAFSPFDNLRHQQRLANDLHQKSLNNKKNASKQLFKPVHNLNLNTPRLAPYEQSFTASQAQSLTGNATPTEASYFDNLPKDSPLHDLTDNAKKSVQELYTINNRAKERSKQVGEGRELTSEENNAFRKDINKHIQHSSQLNTIYGKDADSRSPKELKALDALQDDVKTWHDDITDVAKKHNVKDKPNKDGKSEEMAKKLEEANKKIAEMFARIATAFSRVFNKTNSNTKSSKPAP